MSSAWLLPSTRRPRAVENVARNKARLRELGIEDDREALHRAKCRRNAPSTQKLPSDDRQPEPRGSARLVALPRTAYREPRDGGQLTLAASSHDAAAAAQRKAPRRCQPAVSVSYSPDGLTVRQPHLVGWSQRSGVRGVR